MSGFLLGFVFLIRPQFGWVSQRYAPAGSLTSPTPKFKPYQCILWILSLILLIIGCVSFSSMKQSYHESIKETIVVYLPCYVWTRNNAIYVASIGLRWGWFCFCAERISTITARGAIISAAFLLRDGVATHSLSHAR